MSNYRNPPTAYALVHLSLMTGAKDGGATTRVETFQLKATSWEMVSDILAMVATRIADEANELHASIEHTWLSEQIVRTTDHNSGNFALVVFDNNPHRIPEAQA